jgi:biopolymer transport protein ExbB/TolQ
MSRSGDFIFQLSALLIATIAVHAVYTTVIRPEADAFIAQERQKMAEDTGYVAERSGYVVIKDLEQEACFILAFWALAILAGRDLSRKLEALPKKERRGLLPRSLLAALHRFDTARNIQDVSSAAHAVCEAEGDRLDSELSMIRYIAWAIPSLGFIGTVRGISEALGQAHLAIHGEIAGVTQSLGVAFNSTFVALIISIVLMFIIHQIQLMQERYVLDAQAYCEDKLIRHMHAG